MGQVISSASMSLDGYIARDDNTIGRLFDWLQNGSVEIPTVSDFITLHLSPASAEYMKQWLDGLGAMVCGRTLFDFTDGWDGRHTMDFPVVVVTHAIPADWVAAHPGAPFSFVTDGVDAAVAKAQVIADGRTVAVTAGISAISASSWGCSMRCPSTWCPWQWARGVHILLRCRWTIFALGDPTVCIQGDRVTHLLFPAAGRASEGRG